MFALIEILTRCHTYPIKQTLLSTTCHNTRAHWARTQHAMAILPISFMLETVRSSSMCSRLPNSYYVGIRWAHCLGGAWWGRSNVDFIIMCAVRSFKVIQYDPGRESVLKWKGLTITPLGDEFKFNNRGINEEQISIKFCTSSSDSILQRR